MHTFKCLRALGISTVFILSSSLSFANTPTKPPKLTEKESSIEELIKLSQLDKIYQHALNEMQSFFEYQSTSIVNNIIENSIANFEQEISVLAAAQDQQQLDSKTNELKKKQQQWNDQKPEVIKNLTILMSNLTQNSIEKPEVQQEIKRKISDLYTQEEINAYIRFLKTPEGKSINQKSNQLNTELQLYIGNIIQQSSINSNINQDVEKVLAPLLK